jgi:cytochrome b561
MRSLPGLFAVWFFHWVTAILVVFILVTSLLSSVGLTSRVFGLRWTEIHLSAGLLILFVIIVRLGRATFVKAPLSIATFWRRGVKFALLLLSLMLPISGLLIFQQPPLSRPVLIFGAVRFPVVFELDHSVHVSMISFHEIGSYLLFTVLLIHIALAMIKPKGYSNVPLVMMLWPWKSHRFVRTDVQFGADSTCSYDRMETPNDHLWGNR